MYKRSNISSKSCPFLWTEEDTLKTGFKVLHHMMSQNFNIKKYILLKKKGYINFEVQKDQNLS